MSEKKYCRYYMESSDSGNFEKSESVESSTAGDDKDRLDYIIKSGSVVSESAEETIQCLTIIGQIEGHYTSSDGQKSTKYEHLIPLLVSIEENDDVDGVLVVLNTMGGDVEAGLALSEMIASMSKPVVSLVLGGGHSIGVPLAVSSKRSFIVPSATMTIHPVRISGTVIGSPQTVYYFERMQKRISDFIISHSSVDRNILDKLMMATDQLATDVGSVIDGNEAVKIGLINEIGGLKDAVACLKEMIKAAKDE